MTLDRDNLTFGKRHGLEPIEVPFQISDIDITLRTELWNAFYLHIQDPYEKAHDFDKKKYLIIYKTIWIYYFKKAIDDFPRKNFDLIYTIRYHIKKGTWYKVYEFFEFLLRDIQDFHQVNYEYASFERYINKALKGNNSAYTLSNNKFVPIINDTEISEIKKTQSLSENYSLTGIQTHLNSSIELLSQKPNPDFRNSIKESISMVEVISRIIEPTQSTLGKALNKLDKKQKINKVLKEGFEKLYAYTNDTNGIRHALMEDENLELEDAKFFLISCSAFTNYLIEKAIKENLINIKN